MGKLCEGARVLDFVAGVTPIGATTYLNEVQDQLKAMLGPRDWFYGPGCFSNTTSGTWALDSGNPPTLKDPTQTAGGICVIPIIAPVGSVLKGASVWISGAAGETGGEIAVYRSPNDGSAGRTSVSDLGGVNPWAYAVATEHDAAFTHTILADYYYWIECVNMTGAPATNTIFGASVTLQFGN